MTCCAAYCKISRCSVLDIMSMSAWSQVDVNIVREAKKKRKNDDDPEDTVGVDWELANRSGLSLASKQGNTVVSL